MSRKPGWNEVRQGHLLVRYKVGRVKGQEVVTALCVEPHPEARWDEVSIRGSDLAAIKPRDLIRGYQQARKVTDSSGLFTLHVPPPYSEEHLERVRQLVLWSIAHPEGPSPSALVQSLLGVSPATAHRYIAAARERFPDMPPRDPRGRRPKAPRPEASPANPKESE